MSAHLKEANPRFRRRLHTRLSSNAIAIRAIQSQFGIDQRVADRFQLGLSEQYPKSATCAREVLLRDALVAPVFTEDGRFLNRYVYHHLTDITVDNRIGPPDSWCAGASETYFSRKRGPGDSVIVCDDIRDLWALAVLMQDNALEETHVIIAPTQHGVWPDSWRAHEFWNGWKRVNIAVSSVRVDNANEGIELDRRARELGAMMSRDVHRVMPYKKASWLAASLDGIRYDTFKRQVKDAALWKAADLRRDEGRRYSSATGEDLSCSYHRGHLYEAIRVLETDEVKGQKTQRLRTIVVRSDRTKHVAQEVAAPPDAPRSERVSRLVPDGALLRRLPTPSSDSTWRWSSVHSYLYENASAPPLESLIQQISAHLRASVWLPFESDYLLLACVVVTTYCQQIFDAVPLVLVTGPAGSGKTALSSAISRLAANSPGPIGVISAASLTRLADVSHGFLAIDDLEKLKSMRGNDPLFNGMIQALKLSYKKESAQRIVTDVNRNNELQRINFFGVKLVSNTTGVDDILGTRMLTISTRPMPAGEKLPREGRLDHEQCAQLRDHLHVWVFTHVDEIARTYGAIFPDVSTRDVEIFAPIRVLAELTGSDSIAHKVDEALGAVRQSSTSSAIEIMEDALLGILTKSIVRHRRLPTVATVLEVHMRLRIQEGRQLGTAHAMEPSDLDSLEWIGRQFKNLFAAVGAEGDRFELHGRGSRYYSLSPDLLNKALALVNVKREDVTEDSNPRAFCDSCATCDYQDICDMRVRKLRADARANASALRARPSVENAQNDQSGLH